MLLLTVPLPSPTEDLEHGSKSAIAISGGCGGGLVLGVGIGASLKA